MIVPFLGMIGQTEIHPANLRAKVDGAIVMSGRAWPVSRLPYAIGVAEPVSFLVETFGTGQRNADEIVSALRDEFDLTPAGILKTLDLRWPIYERTTNYGHFGRERAEFEWERDVAEE